MSDVKIEAFLNTYYQLRAAVDGLDEDQVRWKQDPDKWSVQEVVSHLVDHSIVISFRVRDILAGTKVQLPAFNQDAWVSGQYANEGSLSDILDVFNSLLWYNGLLLRRLSSADFSKTGVNFKGETVSVLDIIIGFTNHVQNHLGQIERIKQAANFV